MSCKVERINNKPVEVNLDKKIVNLDSSPKNIENTGKTVSDFMSTEVAKQHGTTPTISKGIELVTAEINRTLGKDVMYRGEGNNYAQGVNEGFLWVAETKSTARNYGEVREVQVTKPKNPFEFPFKSNLHVPGSTIGEKFRMVLYNQIDEKLITPEEGLRIMREIVSYEALAGEEFELYHTKLNKPGVPLKVMEILKALGYDGLFVPEGDGTYGIFKSPIQNTIDKVKSEQPILTGQELSRAVLTELLQQESGLSIEAIQNINISPETLKDITLTEYLSQVGTYQPKSSVSVYITPATVRSFSEETSRLKTLTDEYSRVASEVANGNLTNAERFTELQNEILDKYQAELQEKVDAIQGVTVEFNSPFLGAWEGEYEPSLNMTLHIGENADTEALSNLLFDLAETTSQDAFILESDSEIEGFPLTESTEDGRTHYPQITIGFAQELTVEEKSQIAKSLTENGINEFSIDGDFFIINIIDFNSETDEQKDRFYETHWNTIQTLFGGESAKVGGNNVTRNEVSSKSSRYVDARNAGDKQSQTRQYDKRNLFEEYVTEPESVPDSRQFEYREDVTDFSQSTDIASELAKVERIGENRAEPIARIINTAKNNIAKRLGIPREVYDRNHQLRTIANVDGVVSEFMANSILNTGLNSNNPISQYFGATEFAESEVLNQQGVNQKYVRNLKLGQEDYILSTLLDKEASFGFLGFKGKLTGLGNRENIVKELETRLQDIHRRARDTNEFYIQSFNRNWLVNMMNQAETMAMKEVFQAMLDGDTYVIEQQLSHLQNQQRNQLLASLDYLIPSKDYSPEFKYLMIGAILRGNQVTPVQIRETLTDEQRAQGVEAKVIKEIPGDKVKRNSQTTGDHQELSPMVLPSVYEDMKAGAQELPMQLLEKYTDKSYITKAETAEIIQHRVVKQVPEGQWVKFGQSENNADIDALTKVSKLVEKTGMDNPWCTGGGMAKNYLLRGDFYLFINNDMQPEITIRYVGNRIAELRGTSDGQSLTAQQAEISSPFLQEIPDGENYLQQVYVTRFYTQLLEHGRLQSAEDVSLFIENYKVDIETYNSEQKDQYRELKQQYIKNTLSEDLQKYNLSDEIILADDIQSSADIREGMYILGRIFSMDFFEYFYNGDTNQIVIPRNVTFSDFLSVDGFGKIQDFIISEGVRFLDGFSILDGTIERNLVIEKGAVIDNGAYISDMAINGDIVVSDEVVFSNGLITQKTNIDGKLQLSPKATIKGELILNNTTLGQEFIIPEGKVIYDDLYLQNSTFKKGGEIRQKDIVGIIKFQGNTFEEPLVFKDGVKLGLSLDIIENTGKEVHLGEDMEIGVELKIFQKHIKNPNFLPERLNIGDTLKINVETVPEQFTIPENIGARWVELQRMTLPKGFRLPANDNPRRVYSLTSVATKGDLIVGSEGSQLSHLHMKDVNIGGNLVIPEKVSIRLGTLISRTTINGDVAIGNSVDMDDTFHFSNGEVKGNFVVGDQVDLSGLGILVAQIGGDVSFGKNVSTQSFSIVSTPINGSLRVGQGGTYKVSFDIEGGGIKGGITIAEDNSFSQLYVSGVEVGNKVQIGRNTRFIGEFSMRNSKLPTEIEIDPTVKVRWKPNFNGSSNVKMTIEPNTNSPRLTEITDSRGVMSTLIVDPDIQSYFQDRRGAFIKTPQKTLTLLDKNNADVTTPIHELAHEYEAVLSKEEIQIIEEWSGHKYGTEAFSEAFAKGAERYIFEGTTFLGKVDEIFQKLKAWFKEVILDAIAYFEDINSLNPEMIDVYNRMFMDGTITDSEVHIPYTEEQRIAREKRDIRERAIQDGTFMKAPNGQPTNLTEDQWLTVRTRNFIAWFGDWLNDPENASKVVDENGEPLVVAHSTDKEFYEFKNQQENDSGWAGSGYYFFGDRSLDGQYGKNVMETFLNIRNPYYLPYDEFSELSELDTKEASKEFTDDRINEGYDGVYFNGNLNQEWVAYNPNQIKSATDNVGTFSNESDNIRLQQGRQSTFKPISKRQLNQLVRGLSRAFKKAGKNTKVHVGAKKMTDRLNQLSDSMQEQGIQFLQTKNGTIYGFVDPVTGDIYMDGDLMNANTPIHEFGHLWITNVQQTNSKLWERMVNLAKETPEWKRLANDPNYKQGQFKGKKGKALDNAIADEVWATIIGNHGENNFEAILEKMNGDRNLAQKIWDAIRDFWQSVVDFFYDAGIISGDITLPNGVRLQVSAFHGSPHIVDRFSTDYIGTGEGAHAFGWGLYFTDLEGIARHYAKALAITTFKGKKIDDIAFFDKLLSGLDADDASFYNLDKGTIANLSKFREYVKDTINYLEQSIPNINKRNDKFQKLADKYTYQDLDVSELKADIDIYKHFKNISDQSTGNNGMVTKALPLFKAKADAAARMLLEINKGKKNRESVLDSIIDYELRRTKSTLNYYRYIDNNFDDFAISRNLYKVTLHKDKTPDQYTWLEWDKPVKKEIWEKLDKHMAEKYGDRPFYEIIKNYREGGSYDGESLYKELSKFELDGDRGASLLLLSAGIEGIKYPAESISRGATSDNARGFNYVVFDENAVTIEEHIRFQQGNQNTSDQSLQNPEVASIADMALGQMMSGEFGTADPVVDNVGTFDSTNADIRFQKPITHRQQQLEIVLSENPMQDDYHTGIRTIEDIKTFDEVSQGEGLMTTPDFTEQDILKAQQTGEITIYSSYPIKNGVFVTPSKTEAESYVGNKKVFSKKVRLTDVAWIDSLEGQYAVTDYSEEATKEILSKLEMTGLVNSVELLSEQEIDNKLQELTGVGVTVHTLPLGFYVTRYGQRKIYLNKANLNPNTAIHEFAHPYLDALEQYRGDLFEEAINLIDKNKDEAEDYINFIRLSQPSLKKGSIEWKKEILAQIIGDNGARLLESNKQSTLREWLNQFWQALKNILGLQAYSAEEVARMTLKEFSEAVVTELTSGELLFNRDTNFQNWSKGYTIFEDEDIQNLQTGQPSIIKGYHGTTHDFQVFRGSELGNPEGHMGATNYITSVYSDAASNYLSDGADIQSRIDSRTESLMYFLYDELGSIEEQDREEYVIENGYITREDLFFYWDNSYDIGDIDGLARAIAESELLGKEDHVKEVYVKVNNPLALGAEPVYFENDNLTEEVLQGNLERLAEENDMTPEEYLDYYGEDTLRQEAYEYEGIESGIIGALQDALDDVDVWGYDDANTLLEMFAYDQTVELNQLERHLRDQQLENNYGQIVTFDVIGKFFNNLGFDAVILKDVARRFPGFYLPEEAAHIHIQDQYNHNIKNADGTNVTFSEKTNNINYQMSETSVWDNEISHETLISANNEQIKEYAKDIENGKTYLQRLSSQEEQGRYRGGSKLIQLSLFLEQTEGNPQQGELIEEFAKENGMWIELQDIRDNPAYEQITGRFAESIVFKDEARGTVVKVTNADALGGQIDLAEFVDKKVVLDNYLFPETNYVLLGLTSPIKKGKRPSLVIEQNFINSERGATAEEIRVYMESIGFTHEAKTEFISDEYVVTDLHSGNVLVGKDGNLYVVDAIIETLKIDYVTKNRGIGSVTGITAPLNTDNLSGTDIKTFHEAVRMTREGHSQKDVFDSTSWHKDDNGIWKKEMSTVKPDRIYPADVAELSFEKSIVRPLATLTSNLVGIQEYLGELNPTVKISLNNEVKAADVTLKEVDSVQDLIEIEISLPNEVSSTKNIREVILSERTGETVDSELELPRTFEEALEHGIQKYLAVKGQPIASLIDFYTAKYGLQGMTTTEIVDFLNPILYGDANSILGTQFNTHDYHAIVSKENIPVGKFTYTYNSESLADYVNSKQQLDEVIKIC